MGVPERHRMGPRASLEKPEHCNEEQPQLATTRESLCLATKTKCNEK